MITMPKNLKTVDNPVDKSSYQQIYDKEQTGLSCRQVPHAALQAEDNP
jgi:hypothetical protein